LNREMFQLQSGRARKVQRVVGEFIQEPRLSVHVLRLLYDWRNATERDPAYWVEQLEEDRWLAAETLRLLNRGFSGEGRYENLRKAVAALSPAPVFSAAIILDLSRDSRRWSPSTLPLLLHSAAVGLTAALLFPRESLALPAGLLHDLGKLVFWKASESSYRNVWNKAAETGQPLERLEEVAFGVSHMHVGRTILMLWNVPRPVALAAWLHHQEAMDLREGPAARLALKVKIADNLVLHWRLGESGRSVPELSKEEILRHSNRSATQVEDILSNLRKKLKLLKDYFPWVLPDDARLASSELLSGQEELEGGASQEALPQLSAMRRRLDLRDSVLEALDALLAETADSTRPEGVLVRAIELLDRVVPDRQLIGAVVRETGGRFEACWKKPGESHPENMTLDLASEEISEMIDLGFCYPFLRLLRERRPPEPPVFLAIPFQARGILFGGVWLHGPPEDPLGPDAVLLLQHYLRTAAAAMDRSWLLSRVLGS
jgi:hypothetical protein